MNEHGKVLYKTELSASSLIWRIFIALAVIIALLCLPTLIVTFIAIVAILLIVVLWFIAVAAGTVPSVGAAITVIAVILIFVIYIVFAIFAFMFGIAQWIARFAAIAVFVLTVLNIVKRCVSHAEITDTGISGRSSSFKKIQYDYKDIVSVDVDKKNIVIIGKDFAGIENKYKVIGKKNAEVFKNVYNARLNGTE